MKSTQAIASTTFVNRQRLPHQARRLVALVLFTILILAALVSAYSALRLLESRSARMMGPDSPVTRTLEELEASVHRLQEAEFGTRAILDATQARWSSTDPEAVAAFGAAYRNWRAFGQHDLAIEIRLAKRLRLRLASVAVTLGVDVAAPEGGGIAPPTDLPALRAAIDQLDDLLGETLNAQLREARRVHARDMEAIHDATRRFVVVAGVALLAFLALAVAYLAQVRRYDRYLERMSSLAEVVSTRSGVPLFEAMVSALGRLLDVDYVYIGRLLQGGSPRIETLAVYAHGGLAGNISYSLPGTPCQNVVSGGVCFYPDGVRQQFPDDRLLQEMAVEGYAGIPLFDSQGEALGILVLLDAGPLDSVDLSSSLIQIVASRAQTEIERQQAEDAKYQVMQELEARVDARTADLRRINEKLSAEVEVRAEIESKLERARAEAVDANRLKGEFLANASHEIRTHINGLLGMLSLLEDSQLQGEQVEFVDMAHMSGDILLALINDLLDYSKIEAGQLDLEEIDFDLRRLVGEVVDLFAVRARGAGLELLHTVDARVERYYCGDAVRIRQVLSNMVDNALKFTEQGHVHLRVVPVGEAGEATTLRFEVEDTGIGIDPDSRQRLFEPFSQADGTITRRFGGTGLGLAICAQLVRLLGGEIDAEGQPGVGTRFWFSVPLRVGAGLAAHEDPGPGSRSAGLEGLRALVVDDSTVSRTYLRGLLTTWKVACDSAVDAAQALEEMRSAVADGTPYDLVILDRMMPRMDGLELARTIRADPELAATRLVMATHYGAGISDGEVALSGVDACLAKPVSQSRLFDTVATLFAIGAERRDAQRSDATRRAGAVLVVEDNQVNQRVAAGLLKKLGYRAAIAENGREALDTLAKGGFDLVLMDCQMPVMDGYEAVAELRRRERGGVRHLPVIAMTAHALGGEREKCLAAGMDDYLAKPVRLGDLEQKLDYWCANIPPSAEAEAGAPDPTPPQASDPGADAPAVAPVDRAAMDGLRDIMGAGLEELMATYLADSDARLLEMGQAVDRDHARLARLAHTLKGSSANLGARHLAALCAKLHVAAGSASTATLADLLQQVRDEYARVREALRRCRTSA